MAYPDITSSAYNMSEGPHVVLQYVVDVVPGAISAIAFLAILLLTITTYVIQTLRKGQGDLPVSLFASSFVVFLFIAVISLIDDVVAGHDFVLTFIILMVSLIFTIATRAPEPL